MTRHVAVLMGGRSVEREVSLVSRCSLRCGPGGARLSGSAGSMSTGICRACWPSCGPNVVFNALHGRYGRGRAGAGPARPDGHALTPIRAFWPRRSRWTSRWPSAMFASDGLTCPDGVEASLGRDPATGCRSTGALGGQARGRGLEPGRGHPDGRRRDPADRAQRHRPQGEILVERYIPGRELTCAVLGDAALAVTELCPSEGFYDYRAKYTAGFARHDRARASCPRPSRSACSTGRCGRIGCWAAAASAGPISASSDEGGGRPLSARGQHPAGDDAHVPCAGAGGLSWDLVRRSRPQASRGSAMRPVRRARNPRARHGASGTAAPGAGSCGRGRRLWPSLCWGLWVPPPTRPGARPMSRTASLRPSVT